MNYILLILVAIAILLTSFFAEKQKWTKEQIRDSIIILAVIWISARVILSFF